MLEAFRHRLRWLKNEVEARIERASDVGGAVPGGQRLEPSPDELDALKQVTLATRLDADFRRRQLAHRPTLEAVLTGLGHWVVDAVAIGAGNVPSVPDVDVESDERPSLATWLRHGLWAPRWAIQQSLYATDPTAPQGLIGSLSNQGSEQFQWWLAYDTELRQVLCEELAHQFRFIAGANLAEDTPRGSYGGVFSVPRGFSEPRGKALPSERRPSTPTAEECVRAGFSREAPAPVPLEADADRLRTWFKTACPFVELPIYRWWAGFHSALVDYLRPDELAPLAVALGLHTPLTFPPWFSVTCSDFTGGDALATLRPGWVTFSDDSAFRSGRQPARAALPPTADDSMTRLVASHRANATSCDKACREFIAALKQHPPQKPPPGSAADGSRAAHLPAMERQAEASAYFDSLELAPFRALVPRDSAWEACQTYFTARILVNLPNADQLLADAVRAIYRVVEHNSPWEFQVRDLGHVLVQQGQHWNAGQVSEALNALRVRGPLSLVGPSGWTDTALDGQSESERAGSGALGTLTVTGVGRGWRATWAASAPE